MPGFANEVHDGPMFLSLLQVFGSQFRGLVSPQSASQQKGQDGPVTFALHPSRVGSLPKRAGLLSRKSVSQANTILLHASYAPNSGGQIGAEQATIGGLISQPPNSAETKIDGPRGQAPRFEMAAIPQNHNAIECQPWF